MWIGWSASVALACGGLFAGPSSAVFSDAQLVLLEPDGASVSVTYAVSYGGDAEDFGWVIPLPGAFESIEEADPELFADLDARTAPQVRWNAPEQGGGCGPATKGGSDRLNGIDTGDGVVVVGTGTAGIFDYAVLEATDTVAMLQWLDAAGFEVGPSGPALDAYVAEGGHTFVALSMSEDPTLLGPTPGTEPRVSVRLRYAGSTASFPARMSLYSMAPDQRTTVYLRGSERAEVHGWGAVELGTRYTLDSDPDYAADVGAASEAEATYVRTWAGPDGGAWLTRYDVWAASDLHTSDPSFTFDGGTETVQTRYEVFEDERERDRARAEAEGTDGCGCSTELGSGAAGGLLLAALALGRRRHN